MNIWKNRWILAAIVLLAAAALALAWTSLRQDSLPGGFARSNGRIEAVEIDIASKISGRIHEIFVEEGAFVTKDQILAQMDMATLEAQRREAEAGLRQALIGVETTRHQVVQRESEKEAADAIVEQRQAEYGAAEKRFARTKELATKGAASSQKLDDDRTTFTSASAALAAAKAQRAGAEAAIGLAKAQIVAAEAQVEATRATIERIQADIDDATLKSPRDGRIQYIVARPGEIVAAGGTILNLVDLGDVYMTFFLPTRAAGRLALGGEARVVLDLAPEYVIPATVSFVADVAQFTPKTVETAEERQKLTFRVKAQIAPDLLKKHIRDVKTGLPGIAYVRFDPAAEWPPELEIKLPDE